MMLMQAGQLGLYRKDSIWTEEIPPDMVSGATMWIDFTDPETMFKGVDYNLGTPAHGEGIRSVMNKVAPANGVISAGVYTPTLKDFAANAGPALFAAPPVNALAVPYVANVASGAAAVSMSSLISATTKLVFAAVKVVGASDHSDSIWITDSLLSDAGAYVGLHVSDAAGVLSAHAYNYSGGIQLASRVLPRGDWAVVTMSHQSGQLRCRVNGGAWATTASGTTGTLAGSAYTLGLRTPGVSSMEVAHIATVNTPQTDAAISAVEHWLALDVGITPWW